jgi:NAD(P)-dependent dehydrogenase (short-subunit alcohol dehydrogenase family)
MYLQTKDADVYIKRKVAVITGASSANGIGHAIAKRFARAGASCI